ncbi:hypothetical protein JY419_02000 [Stenotrophomonas maltophilia]|nr:hypothetical protein [Stenotrophomonas maltophilia]
MGYDAVGPGLAGATKEMVMAINANSLVLAKDLELPPGAILYSNGAWRLRVHLEENGKQYEGTVALTGERPGEYGHLEYPSSCLAIPKAVSLEVRVVGAPDGPGEAPFGSLAWGPNGVSLVGFVRGPFWVTFSGLESNDLPILKDFHAKHWEMWAVDGNGDEVGGAPLFTVKID